MNVESKSFRGLSGLFTTQMAATQVTVNADANSVRIHTPARTPEEAQRLGAAAHAEIVQSLAKLRSILAAATEHSDIQNRCNEPRSARQWALRSVVCLTGTGLMMGGAATHSVTLVASGAGTAVLSVLACSPRLVVAFARSCCRLNDANKGREDLFDETAYKSIPHRIRALKLFERELYPHAVADQARRAGNLPAELAQIISDYSGPMDVSAPSPDQQAMS